MWILCLQILDGTHQSNTQRDPQRTLHMSFHYLLNYIEYIYIYISAYNTY